MLKIKIIICVLIGAMTLIVLAGVYKFNYLTSKNSYDVDGNKLTETNTASITSLDTNSQEDASLLNVLEENTQVATDSKDLVEKANTKIKLLPPADGKIYFAAFPDFGGDEKMVTANRIDKFEKLAGKKLTWAPFTQTWYQGIVYPKEKIHTLNDHGTIPLIRFAPRSTTREGVREIKFSLTNIIDGSFDKELTKWAQEARADNIPLLVDFGYEMNGSWFPWNGQWNGGGIKNKYGDETYPDGPEKYRDAYRHIIDIFRKEKVIHVTWFFHPTMYTQEPAAEWNSPKYYYPGDDYIDWIGFSIYGALHPGEDYWDTYDDVLTDANAYKKMLEISSHKPFAILEMGVTDHHPLGNKSVWLKNAFQKILLGKYMRFQAVNYWHENWDNDGSLTSLKIDSSSSTLKTFQTLISDPFFISEGRFSK
jgi:hypothetical protein